MSALSPELTVRRPVYQQDELNHLCKYAKPNEARKYRAWIRVDFDRANIEESWRRDAGLFTISQSCNPYADNSLRFIPLTGGMKTIANSLRKLRFEESTERKFH